MPQDSIKQSSYLPTLDGWRALAILMVLMNHFGPSHNRLLTYITWHGQRGVALFFALSGVLICTRLLREESIAGRISLRNFYIRRVFRIQPASLVYLAVLALLMLAHVLPCGFSGIGYALVFLRNYLPLDSGPTQWYTDHFWSLCVEEHFYLFLPGFLVLTPRRWREWALAAIIAVIEAWKYVILPRHGRLARGWSLTVRTDYAVDGILLAVLLALLLSRPAVRDWLQRTLRPWLAMTLTAIAWILVDRTSAPAAAFFLLVAFALLVVSTMLHAGSLSGRFLELKQVCYVGRLSYSLYLWQMLFFVGGPYMIPLSTNSALLNHIQQSFWRWPVLFATAAASFYLVETPLIKVGHRLAKSVVPSRT